LLSADIDDVRGIVAGSSTADARVRGAASTAGQLGGEAAGAVTTWINFL